MEPLNILSAYLLDLAFGDPQWFPHPVRITGKIITFLEDKLRSGQKKYILRLKGAMLAVTVVGVSALAAYLFLTWSKRINSTLGVLTWIFLAYTSLAIKDLFLHVKGVLKEVKRKNLDQARTKLSCIVGRDTCRFSEEEIVRATIESIAENTNDGIIAPLFYLILGGPILALTYKAINTLDSMIGHKNEKYKDFGWFSARLDDVANFIPARISGLLISISCLILGKNFKNSLLTMIKDSNKHFSPNAGFPEAAMAGALGIKLGGPSTYEGQLCVKPYIGKGRNHTQPQLINEALSITFISSLFMVSIGTYLKWII